MGLPGDYPDHQNLTTVSRRTHTIFLAIVYTKDWQSKVNYCNTIKNIVTPAGGQEIFKYFEMDNKSMFDIRACIIHDLVYNFLLLLRCKLLPTALQFHP